MQPYEGWWLSRSLAREQVHKRMGDTGMMDYMLKAIANRTVGPWAVFRCRCLHCLSCSLICLSLWLLLCALLCPLLCPLLCSSHCPLLCPLLLPFWPHPLPPLSLLPFVFALLTTPSPFIASLALHCLPPLSRSSLKTFVAFRCVLSFSRSSLYCLFLPYAFPCQPHILPSSTVLPFALPLHLCVPLYLPAIVVYCWETKCHRYCPLPGISDSCWPAGESILVTETKCSSTWLSRRMVPLPCLQLMLYTPTLLHNPCYPPQKLLPSQVSCPSPQLQQEPLPKLPPSQQS